MKVKFHNPEYPSGMEFDIGGLLLVNGRTVTFEKDELDTYKDRHGISLKDRLLTNEFATVDGTQGKVKYLHPEESVEEAEDRLVEEVEAEKEGDK